MKQCLFCKKEIAYRKNANNKKYCSVDCRNKGTIEQQRERRARYKEKRDYTPSPHKLQCKICGKWFKKVCSHAYHTHGINEREYKEHIGVDHKKGIVTEAYKEKMREYTQIYKDIVIDKNLLQKGKKTRFTSGNVPKYKRSTETMARLKQSSFIKNKLK